MMLKIAMTAAFLGSVVFLITKAADDYATRSWAPYVGIPAVAIGSIGAVASILLLIWS